MPEIKTSAQSLKKIYGNNLGRRGSSRNTLSAVKKTDSVVRRESRDEAELPLTYGHSRKSCSPAFPFKTLQIVYCVYAVSSYIQKGAFDLA